MRSGETDIAKIIFDKNLESIGKTLAINLKHVANLDVDALEKNNKFYVLELNARFGGGYPFTHLSGVNLPQAIINWALNKKYTFPKVNLKKDVYYKKIDLI